MTYIKSSTVLCLPVTQWPECDQRLWARVLEPAARLFQASSPASKWSPRRRRIVEQGYGQYLAWLDTNGLLDPGAAPEDRVTPERVTRFVAQLIERIAPVSVGMMIGALGRMLAVLSPDTDWAWMRRLYQDLKAWAEPSRDKRAAVVPAKDLFDLGIHLMDTAAAEGRDPYFVATQYRDGLLIALLIARPVRMRNISTIELPQNLVRINDTYWLRFNPEMTKTGIEIDVPIPDVLTERLDMYLSGHRQVLLARRRKGGFKAENCFNESPNWRTCGANCRTSGRATKARGMRDWRRPTTRRMSSGVWPPSRVRRTTGHRSCHSGGKGKTCWGSFHSRTRHAWWSAPSRTCLTSLPIRYARSVLSM